MRKFSALTVTITITALLAGCGGTSQAPEDPSASAASASSASSADTQASFAQHLQKELTNAKPGDVITLPAGHYHLRRGLALNTDNVTVRGAGMDKTVLNFKGMVSGPQGLLVNASDFTIEDLAIEDTKGDGLKVKQGKNIIIRRVRVTWTRGPDANNGGYGLYPIRTTNLLVEDCKGSGASDSGLYVGQSKNVIVRNNIFTKNVAGIEIENTVHADVYGNTTIDNAGGILVFNMPNLMQLGKDVRVYKNKVNHNNGENFGAAGTPVASLPSGSGIVVNSNDDVEIFDNDIADNHTANIIISSYYSTNYDNKTGVNPDYNPYPKGIYIHDNRFSGGGTKPGTKQFQQLKIAVFGKDGHFPDVLWDGYFDPKDVGSDGLPPAKDRICVPDKKVGVFDADGPNGFKHPNMDDKRFRCKLKPLQPPVHLAFANQSAESSP
jgi:parallel beta-helix repeat protein